MALQEDASGNIYDDGYSTDYGPDFGYQTAYTPPPGAKQQDENGNWYDGLGNLIQQVAPLAGKFLTNFTEPYLNNLQSGGLLKDAQGMLKNAGRGIAGLDTPDLMSLIPQLKLQVQQGTMTPAEAQAAFTQVMGSMDAATAQANQQGPSEMRNVQSDQGSIQAQRAALNQLAQLGQNQGLSEADRAQLAAIMNQTNANAAQQRAGQIQQLQMQNQAGSGAELAARLSGAQGAANQNAAMGADIARGAQARALQAIQDNLSGNANLNTQMFSQAAQKAGAQDVVNQFNTQAMNTIAQQNAANQQQANQQNFTTAQQMALANQQAQQSANEANAARAQQSGLTNFNMANQIAGTNVGITNEQAKMPMSVAQQQWTNQFDQQREAAKAQVAAGSALGKMGTDQLTRTNAAVGTAPAAGTAPASSSSSGKKDYSGTGAALGGVVGSIFPVVGTALGSAAGGLLGKIFSDEDLKKDKKELSDDEVDQMMANLTGYKYRYKGDKTNPTQTGVMAQDMPKGSVVDTPAGKMIQKPEAMSAALAVLANQHDRIKRLEGAR